MIHIQSNYSSSSLTNVQSKDIQPNAVDLRLGKVLAYKKRYSGLTEMNTPCVKINDFVIDEERKVHRKTEELQYDDDGYWRLEPGSYEIVFENIITIGEGEAGFVITRSTLNRNGLFLTSGLYDSGYCGPMAGCLHVTGGPAYIKKGTRIGQFLLFKAESLRLYSGDYGFNPDGTAKQNDVKYLGVQN